MLRVQYKGKGERTIGGMVVYPGELLTVAPNLLAAWQAEHGDVFVVVGGAEVKAGSAGTVANEDDAAIEDDAAEADEAIKEAPKGKRK